MGATFNSAVVYPLCHCRQGLDKGFLAGWRIVTRMAPPKMADLLDLLVSTALGGFALLEIIWSSQLLVPLAVFRSASWRYRKEQYWANGRGICTTGSGYRHFEMEVSPAQP